VSESIVSIVLEKVTEAVNRELEAIEKKITKSVEQGLTAIAAKIENISSRVEALESKVRQIEIDVNNFKTSALEAVAKGFISINVKAIATELTGELLKVNEKVLTDAVASKVSELVAISKDASESIKRVADASQQIAEYYKALAEFSKAVEALRNGVSGLNDAVDELRKSIKDARDATNEIRDKLNSFEKSAKESLAEISRRIDAVNASISDLMIARPPQQQQL
jgi:chromosome segregation ATPase